jgi:hypothetical protein
VKKQEEKKKALTSIALLIGTEILAIVITLFFVIVFEAIIKNGEGRGGPKNIKSR